MNVVDTLKERGFIENMTHEKEIYDYFATKPRTCYIGFDPTASSLHIGSLIQIMLLAHMQRHGHMPIALVGGGTGLVGDPSGKTEMRKVLTEETINHNASKLKEQLSMFIDFKNNQALLLNNADWLIDLGYISFLRDIGRHFSVNKMIKVESYRKRLKAEDPLSFIEFNYILLQSFDFLTLFDLYDCRLQMGGSDQWGNIVSGIDLIRRMRQETVFGITSPLITTSDGAKMGKTATGAIWLDPERTSPYEYYQYWVNIDDRDVVRFLSLFTFLPIEEIHAIKKLEGEQLNNAKKVLAFETTAITHGESEAIKAYKSAVSMFNSSLVSKDILPTSNVPRIESDAGNASVPHIYIDIEELKKGIPAFKIFHLSGLANSSGSAKRLIEQGGAYINNEKIKSIEQMITEHDVNNGEILLRYGKKKYMKVKV